MQRMLIYSVNVRVFSKHEGLKGIIMLDYVIKLAPHYEEKIWGWEKWNVSTYPNKGSIISNGKFKGRDLGEFLKLPLLIKILNAKDRLSVQVHPNDEYARKFENESGKNECWYIIKAKPEAKLVVGLKSINSRDELEKVLYNNRLEEHLHQISVERDDFINIPTGTIHAIKEGVRLIEVQQSSDVTYRLYDWQRGRKIDVEKSLDVIEYGNQVDVDLDNEFEKFHNEYFRVEKVELKGSHSISSENMMFCTVINGSFIIETQNSYTEDTSFSVVEEESFIVPCNIGMEVNGYGTLLRVYINS